MRNNKLLIVFILIFYSVTMLVSCSSNDEKGKVNREATAFEEKLINIPEMHMVNDISKDEDDIIMLAYDSLDSVGITKYMNSISSYRSKDGGYTWEKEEFNQKLTNENEENYYSEYVILNNEKKFYYKTNNKDSIKYYIIDKDENYIEFNIDLQQENFFGRKATSYGDLLIMQKDEISIYDSNTGEKSINININENNVVDAVATTEYVFIFTEEGIIDMYSTKSNKKVKSIDVLEEYIDFNTKIYAYDDYTIYLTSSKGIFKYNISKDTVDMVMNGNDFALNDNTLSLAKLFVIDDTKFFILYYSETGPLLYMYTYSEELLNKEKEELNVYSLYYDPFIEQSILRYNRTNNNVDVNYVVGVTEGSGVNKNDAIKTLNTEVIAGNGPDVIFMDNIDSKSFIEKNLLYDLSSIVNNNENIFKGVISSFTTKDNKILTLPLRIQVPSVIGNEEIINNINISNITKNTENYTPLFNEIDFAYYFYNLYVNDILEDKNINVDNLKEYLNNVKYFYKNYTSPIIMDDEFEYDSKEMFLESHLDRYPCLEKDMKKYSMFNLMEVNDFITIYSLIKNIDEIQYKTLKSEGGNPFVAKKLISINSNGENIDVAKGFVEAMLSEQCQTYNARMYKDGLSINKVSLNKLFDDEKKYGGGGFSAEGENGIVEIIEEVPPTEEIEKLINELNNLNEPIIVNDFIMDIIVIATEVFLKDNYTLDEAVDYVLNKVDIYLKE